MGEGGSNKDGTRMNGWLSYSLRIQRTARQQNKTVIYVCFYFFVYNSMEWMDGWDGGSKALSRDRVGKKRAGEDIEGVIGSEEAEKKTKSEEAIFLYLVNL